MVALTWADDKADDGRGGVDRAPRPGTPGGGSRGSSSWPSFPGRAQRGQTYFWRRLGVVLAIAGLGALVWSGGERLVAGASVRPGGPVSCPAGQVALPVGAEADDNNGCGAPYVARAGDTVWGIAVHYSRGADPRALEDELQAEVPGGVLQPGERLVVPS